MTQERYATKSQYDRLAKRVDSLDDELKLLKAQIQATLLTIQECILNSTFPTLRDGVKPQINAGERRQWNIKKFGVGQAKAIPGVYSADAGFEPDAVPPFDPPILEDSDPYTALPDFLTAEIDELPDEQWQFDPPRANPPAQTISAANGPFNRQYSAYRQRDNSMPQRLTFNAPIPQINDPSEYSDSRNPPIRTTQTHTTKPLPPQPAPQENHSAVASDTSNALGFDAWRELDKWVSEKIKEVGIVGALELAHLCGGQQRETLIRIISIYEARSADKPGADPTPPSSVEPTPVQATPLDERPEAARAKYATYRPFGEHQELALQLLEQVLRAREATPVANGNGNGKH